METFHPEGWPKPAVPLSHAVKAGGWLYVSGQVAQNPDGSAYIGDFTAEVNGAIDSVETVLKAAGASLENVVKLNAFLSNGVLFSEFNKIYAERITAGPPARTTTVTGFGNANVRVEIDAIAYVGE